MDSVLAAKQPRKGKRTRAHGAVRVLTPRQRLVHLALAAVWVFIAVRFWKFWLDAPRGSSDVLFALTTFALAYLTTFLPTAYWFYVWHMRRPIHIPAPRGLRVAIISPCVPSSESPAIIERQIRALAAVTYPHDSYILDEGGEPWIEQLCEAHGVSYFTRKGIERWNEEGPPFQKKTKAGNVNAWLDHVTELGREYDFFVQLDIDHEPRPAYLDRTLGHFNDPTVAWVQAPSVYSNLDVWTARGCAELDLAMHGPLQMGFYGHSSAPFIIGSHTTYRTSAIRKIGGFQPTRAEDHLDTVVLAAHGYRGVFVSEIIAEGEGAEDFGIFLQQQFAWAYSMMQIFLTRMPKMAFKHTLRQTGEFFFAQSWYPLWAMSLASLWALPAVALLTDTTIAEVPLSQFFAYYLSVLATTTLMWWWTREWFQPRGLVVSWRGCVLELARWPVVLWAFVNVVFRVSKPYMITRKGNSVAHALPSAKGLYGPYMMLAALSLASIVVWHVFLGPTDSQGYLPLVILNLGFIMLLLPTVVGLELRDLHLELGTIGAALRARLSVVVLLALLTAGVVLAVANVWSPLMEAIG